MTNIAASAPLSCLNRLELVMNISAAAEEKAMTWLKCVEVGGTEAHTVSGCIVVTIEIFVNFA